MSRLAAGLLCVLVTTAQAQRPKAPAVPQGWTDFVEKVDAYADTNRIVGASAAFVRDGKILARHDYGFADRATGRRVDERTLFHWGSITKTLTGIAIMQLRDQGKLNLDDPATRWIPELRLIHDSYGSPDSITIRMLLAHTSGLQGGTWPWTQGRAWELQPRVHLPGPDRRSDHRRPVHELRAETHLCTAQPLAQLLRHHTVLPRPGSVARL